jgi:hypothetical protein
MATPLPSRQQYAHALARVVATLRFALDLVEDTREMPLRGFGRLWDWGRKSERLGGTPAELRDELLTDLNQHLRGCGYNVMQALGAMESELPADVGRLADRLHVQLILGEGQESGNPNAESMATA